MPKESFFNSGDSPETSAEYERLGLHIKWGDKEPKVTVGHVTMEWSGLNRMIRTLRKARDQTYGAPE